MRYQVKVKNTQTYSDGQGSHKVCKATLILREENGPIHVGLVKCTKPYNDGFTDFLLGNYYINNNPKLHTSEHVSSHWLNVRPLIVSETEPIEEGDDRWFEGCKDILGTTSVEAQMLKNNRGIWKKVIAIPAQLTSKHLQAIVDKKLTSGDVLIECEEFENWDDDSSLASIILNGNEKYTRIKTDSSDKITLFPLKEKMFTKADICRAFNAGKQNTLDVSMEGGEAFLSGEDYYNKEFNQSSLA